MLDTFVVDGHFSSLDANREWGDSLNRYHSTILLEKIRAGLRLLQSSLLLPKPDYRSFSWFGQWIHWCSCSEAYSKVYIFCFVMIHHKPTRHLLMLVSCEEVSYNRRTSWFQGEDQKSVLGLGCLFPILNNPQFLPLCLICTQYNCILQGKPSSSWCNNFKISWIN